MTREVNKRPLSKQLQMLEDIAAVTELHGRAPSLNDLEAYIESSTRAVLSALTKLERNRWVSSSLEKRQISVSRGKHTRIVTCAVYELTTEGKRYVLRPDQG